MGRNAAGVTKGVNGQIVLCDYRTEKALFEHFPGAATQAEIELEPSFYRNSEPENGGLYRVSLGVRIDEPDKIPYRVEVIVCGIFKFNGLSEDQIDRAINTNVIAILFPYLRTTLASLMAISGVQPVYLPVVNAAALFSQLEHQE